MILWGRKVKSGKREEGEATYLRTEIVNTNIQVFLRVCDGPLNGEIEDLKKANKIRRKKECGVTR